jgi:cytoskeleton protein RodZ
MMTALPSPSWAAASPEFEDCVLGSFGERLQREREMRGITLDEIAEATKIGTRSLHALEEQDFDKLPGGIFNKGFVRAYSRYLGLDEDQAVADYLSALSEAQAAGKVLRQEPTTNLTNPERAALVKDADDNEPMRLPLGLIVAVVVIGVLLFAGWKYVARNGLPKLRHVRAASQQQSPQPAPKAAALPDLPRSGANALQPSNATAAAANALQPSNATAGGAKAIQPLNEFVVRVKARQDTWISITADGKPVMSGTLRMATEQSVHAQHSVVLKAGNVAGIELFHNEKPVRPLGAEGQVKTVEFTAAGLRD